METESRGPSQGGRSKEATEKLAGVKYFSVVDQSLKNYELWPTGRVPRRARALVIPKLLIPTYIPTVSGTLGPVEAV